MHLKMMTFLSPPLSPILVSYLGIRLRNKDELEIYLLLAIPDFCRLRVPCQVKYYP